MNGDDPKLVMARRIADTACEPIKAPRHSSPWEASYRSALAAIEECTEAHARIAEAHACPTTSIIQCHYDQATHDIAGSIRDHLKGPTDASTNEK